MSDNPPIEFAFPELRRWEKGAAPYIHVLERGKPGPAVMVAALTHGNEVSGAVVVDALLAAGLKPRQGTLIFSFNNIEAYHSFDAKTPFKSRLVDEDFNRTWGRLDQPANTVETRRAQVVRPFIERADFLLDLHSMHDDGVPLMLAGPLDKGVVVLVGVCALGSVAYAALGGLLGILRLSELRFVMRRQPGLTSIDPGEQP